MKITDIKVNKAEGDSKLKAFASVTFDGCFAVHGIKIFDGEKGLFISMPSRKGKDDAYLDVAHPVTKEFQKELSDAILAKYKEN